MYVPWELAWREALYGSAGFFRRPEGPAGHFRTASTSAALAAALVRLAADVDVALGEPADFAVVDVGAGRGELLARLASLAPPRWQLIGVDVVDRPAGLEDRIRWSCTVPEATIGLVLAHELLDAVPCAVVECDDGGTVRLVLVNPVTGAEHLGAEVGPTDAGWLSTWWPLEPGRRAEVGIPREETWLSLVGSLRAGIVLAVDYAHSRDDRSRDAFARGSLAAYQDGSRVPPIPDGSCDLTAHVALDSCAAVTPTDGWTLLTRQADLLPALGVTSALPPSVDASSDPRTYALRLVAASDARILLDPSGPGGFGWLLHGRGLPASGMMRP